MCSHLILSHMITSRRSCHFSLINNHTLATGWLTIPLSFEPVLSGVTLELSALSTLLWFPQFTQAHLSVEPCHYWYLLGFIWLSTCSIPQFWWWSNVTLQPLSFSCLSKYPVSTCENFMASVSLTNLWIFPITLCLIHFP